MTRTDDFRPLDVPVRGGTLRVGVREATTRDGGAAPTVVAVHGITASHRAFLALARALPEMRIVAPDLRGRGRSADLPGPYGLEVHADDVATVLDRCVHGPVVVVGHSMGAFVGITLAHRHPGRVRSLVLVDGGVPLAVPAGTTREQHLAATLAPATRRLSQVFPDGETYRRFWREHPALRAHWSPDIADFADYDLVGEPPQLRPSVRLEAVAQDGAELGEDGPAAAAWRGVLPPVHFLRAPRGLADEPGGLYPEAALASFAEQHALPVEQTTQNHYTVLMSDAGAVLVARAVRSALTG